MTARDHGDLYLSTEFRALLADSGLQLFHDFWSLPEEFVDQVNIRKGGWSAVSRLCVESPAGSEVFFVKRQENQLRRRPMSPWGKLTFAYEAEGILRNQHFQLPCVDLVGFGQRKIGRQRQAILITRGLEYPSLAELLEQNPEHRNLTNVLNVAGKELLKMHNRRISHGALYSKHLYLDLPKKQTHLIDFERSRMCLTVSSAIKRDFGQFLKYAGNLRNDELYAFMEHHMATYPRLMHQLIEKSHDR